MKTVKVEQILRVAIALLLVALLGVIYRSFHERIVGVGDSAPDFTVVADNGRTVSLDDFGGRLLILNFWATWCPPCIQEMPSLDELQKRFKDSGVVVLGLSVDKNEKDYRNLLSKANVSFLTARDPENRINQEYGTFKFPETYIISKNGKVIQKIIGPANWTDDNMVGYVRSLL